MGFTADQLNARPWGNQSGSQTIRSAEDLNAGDFSTTPFAKGLTAAEYRAQHDDYGEPFRYWRAYSEEGVNQNGVTYDEITLGTIAKARFHSTRKETIGKDFGVIPTGSTMISCLPEVVEISEGDKLVRTDTRRAIIGRQVVSHGATDTDYLPRRFITQILRVSVDNSPVSIANVTIVTADSPNSDDRGGIRWVANEPAAGAKVFVLYRYQPFYVCLGDSMQGGPLGTDGGLLPQRVLLREERD